MPASSDDLLANGFDDMEYSIMDRYTSQIMSGTEIRKSIANGTTAWKKHVPTVLIQALENEFPEELKLAYNIERKK